MGYSGVGLECEEIIYAVMDKLYTNLRSIKPASLQNARLIPLSNKAAECDLIICIYIWGSIVSNDGFVNFHQLVTITVTQTRLRRRTETTTTHSYTVLLCLVCLKALSWQLYRRKSYKVITVVLTACTVLICMVPIPWWHKLLHMVMRTQWHGLFLRNWWCSPACTGGSLRFH